MSLMILCINVQFIHSEVNPMAFKIIIQYIYTGRLEGNLHLVEDVKLLAKQCRLLRLNEQIDDALKKIKSYGRLTNID